MHVQLYMYINIHVYVHVLMPSCLGLDFLGPCATGLLASWFVFREDTSTLKFDNESKIIVLYLITGYAS